MKKVQIKALRQQIHQDLIDEYEKTLENPCPVNIGSQWISCEAEKPEGFCSQAWLSLYPYVFALANGSRDFFDGWMKRNGTAMVSCNDGFRPFTFYIEVMDEDDENLRNR